MDDAARFLERSFRAAPDDPVHARALLDRAERLPLSPELLLDARATLLGVKVEEALALANEKRRVRTLDASTLARRLRSWFALPDLERALRFVVCGGAPTTQARRDHECYSTRVVALATTACADRLVHLSVGVEVWPRSLTIPPQGSEVRPVANLHVDLMTLRRWIAR